MSREPRVRRDAGDVIRAAGVESVVRSEMCHRDNQKFFGVWDMAIAAKGALAIGYAEIIQTEVQADPSLGDIGGLTGAVAQAPWDWKAVAVGAGAYVFGSAAGRIKERNRLDAEIIETAQQIYDGGQFMPKTEQELKRERLTSRAKRGVLTAAGCVVAYKVGEQGTLVQDLAAEAGLISAAVASIGVAHVRSKQKIKRILRGPEQAQARESYADSDYVDGRRAYSQDSGLDNPNPRARTMKRLGR